MMVAASSSNHSVSVPIVALVLLVLVIYGFGYSRAVMHRANKDYKTTKAAVPVLRKGFWRAWWGAMKVGFWVFLGFAVLVVWLFHLGKNADANTRPSPSVPAHAVHSQR